MKELSHIKQIIAHPGGAHRDDLRSVAIALAVCPLPTPVYRRDPTVEELEDPAVLVLDVGGRHEPELCNFDHHQLDRSAPAVCALSLLLQFLGLYDTALMALPWLRPTEILDAKGPVALGKELGVDFATQVVPLLEPETNYLIKQFSDLSRIEFPAYDDVSGGREGDMAIFLFGMGLSIVKEITDTQYRFQLLDEVAKFLVDGVLDTRKIPGSQRPAFAVDAWCRMRGHNPRVIVANDDRGYGWSLYRVSDATGIDFSLIEVDSRVVFAHKGGFIAKTVGGLTEDDLDELLQKSTAGVR